MSDLDELYALVPAFECEPGCTECCGPIVFARGEWDRLEDKRESEEERCPYLGAGGCEIYEQRPMMCRLLGSNPDWPCPRGRGPERPIDWEQAYVLQMQALGTERPHYRGARYCDGLRERLEAHQRREIASRRIGRRGR